MAVRFNSTEDVVSASFTLAPFQNCSIFGEVLPKSIYGGNGVIVKLYHTRWII